jgi:SAM-dependent methyltransferase
MLAHVTTVFDRDPDTYAAVRPGYPAALVDDVLLLGEVPPQGLLLEAGCGTGQATRLFAARGHRVVAVEAGERMAAGARARLTGLAVEVRHGRFEDVPLPSPVDLVYSATAWHWIDPVVGYARAAALVRPRGPLALFWNEHVRGDDDVGFFDMTQDLYERAGMGHSRLAPVTELPDRTPTIVASGCFGDVVRRQYPWRAEYDAATYAKLLGTYSNHIRLDEAVRTRLLDGIRALIDTQFSGRIVKQYVTDLYFARRSPSPSQP